MRPVLSGALLLGFCLVVWARADPPLAIPHPADFHYQASYANRPMGILGLRLGTFAVIEGTEHHTDMAWGSDDFVIEIVNGKKLDHEIRIQTDWSPQFADKAISGKRYVLHGFEAGKWEGQPQGLPATEPVQTQTVVFFLQHTFVVTSVEKIDGVTVADARPLDPQVPLDQPESIPPSVQGEAAPPLGLLGLPLGTFAVLKVQKPTHSYMLGNPYEVIQVNGVKVDPPRPLSIPGLSSTSDKSTTLRGYETGEWGSEPHLPKSENPWGTEVQEPFQFFRHFVMTSCEK